MWVSEFSTKTLIFKILKVNDFNCEKFFKVIGDDKLNLVLRHSQNDIFFTFQYFFYRSWEILNCHLLTQQKSLFIMHSYHFHNPCKMTWHEMHIILQYIAKLSSICSISPNKEIWGNITVLYWLLLTSYVTFFMWIWWGHIVNWQHTDRVV